KSADDMLLKVDPGRIITTRGLAEMKRRTYGGEISLMTILSSVVVLLVIVALTSFSVSQRRRQIGTRRALGATRQDILHYFLLENWLVTVSGLVLGLGLAWTLNYTLVKL